MKSPIALLSLSSALLSACNIGLESIHRVQPGGNTLSFEEHHDEEKFIYPEPV